MAHLTLTVHSSSACALFLGTFVTRRLRESVKVPVLGLVNLCLVKKRIQLSFFIKKNQGTKLETTYFRLINAEVCYFVKRI